MLEKDTGTGDDDDDVCTGKRLGVLEKVQKDVKKVEEEAAWELAMEELDNLAEVLKGEAEGQLQEDTGLFQKKEESELQLDGEAAEMEETGGGLEEEEEENDGGLVMEKLKDLEDELDVLKEDLQQG
ncbi:Hypp1483 [Branchiostoma lanceolatum]|uniref:Hypp1483 protein n=1 Tax=Branchiostoma lanceolatum TaxID=7740 RepID=A0A8J9ZJM5_BRALA|nr:Hypp1483 [Branchiostoma lanceolatum]